MVLPDRVSSISPEQVIGSTSRTVLEFRHGISTLVETLDQIFVDDKTGKTVDIDNALLDVDRSCFGNSDGDLELLRYMTIGNPSQSLGMIICHTDENRDLHTIRPLKSGKTIEALQQATQTG